VPLRVLIVDDHVGFRGFARRLLGALGMEVVGEAGEGLAALVEVSRLRPDVVLLDVLLPDVDGFEVARRLAQAERPPLVVLTSSRTAEDFGERLDRAAISAFIAKDELSGAALASALGEAAA
jgi:DNA-binding NarL/FixJ family response regulator